MRNIEEDFDYNFEHDSIVVVRLQDYRIDNYPTVLEKNPHSDNAERKARVAAHTERVQEELKAQSR